MRELSASQGRQLGFSIIELLTVIAILGIVAALAAPSFSEAVVRNRIVSENNDLLAAFNYARSEAIRRNTGVGVCSLDAAFTGCGTGNWDRGWAIWEDQDGQNDFDAAEPILRIFRLNPQHELASTDDLMVFSSRGLLNFPAVAGADPTLTLEPSDCKPQARNIRTLVVRVTGSVTSTTTACP